MNPELTEKYKDLIEALNTVLEEWEKFKIKVNYEFYKNEISWSTYRNFQPELIDIFIHDFKLNKMITKALEKILPENIWDIYLTCPLGGNFAFFHTGLSSRLIYQLIQDNSAKKIIDKLDKVLNTKLAKAFQVAVIVGVNCCETITLTNDIQLIHLENLPNSRKKEMLQESVWINSNALLTNFRQNYLLFEKTQACLIQKFYIDPFIHNEHKTYQPPSANILYEIVLLLTLMSPEPPVIVCSWVQLENQCLDCLMPLEFGSPYHEISPVNYHSPVKELKPIDTKEAQKIVGLYLKISENNDTNNDTRQKLKIGLHRLNIAKRRSNYGDKALEICIALEVLLADGQGENTFKIGLRAGLLLGGDVETRLHHRRIIGGVYSLRSSLVHDGKIGDKVKLVGVGKTDSKEVINEAISITQLVIRKIIELGETPNWYQLELSGGNDGKQLEETFDQLVQQWRTETRGISSSTELILHPAYQQIIGLGKEAIPLLLRELEKKSGRWFWALKSISREDPVLPEQQGKTQEMIQAWLDWGRKNGYQW